MLAIAEDNKRKLGLHERGISKRRDREHPITRQHRGCHRIELRINLSGDKDRVLQEAFRVLKPGGRFAVSDVVVQGEVPAEIRKSMELWVGCVAGALSDRDYRQKLAAGGFEAIDIEATRVYTVDDAREFLSASVSTPTPSRRRCRMSSSALSSGRGSLRKPPPVAIQLVATRESCGARCWTHRACTVRLATLGKWGAVE